MEGLKEDLAKIVGDTCEVVIHEGCAGGVYHLGILLEDR